MPKRDSSKKKASNLSTSEDTTTQVPQDEPTMYRFSVNLAADSAEILRATAARKGVSVTDIFRRAVAMMEGIDKELLAGREIESVDPMDGSRKGFVFL